MTKKNQSSVFNDEIDLINYINVIFKRKKWLFLFFFVSVILALTITILMPKKYTSTAIIRIGEFQNSPLISQEETLRLFQERSYLAKIAEKLNLEPTEKNISTLKKAISLEDKTTKKLITVRVVGNSPKEAKAITDATISVILDESQESYAEKEQILEKRIQNLNKELEDSKKELITIQKNVNLFSFPKNEAEGIALQAYLTREDTINDYIKKIENQLEDIEIKKMENENSSIVSPSFLPEKKISPSLKINLIVAALLGIFIAFIWIFVLEWWQINKAKLKKKK